MNEAEHSNLQRLENLLESVRKGVDEAKAGRFEAADAILQQLRDEYEKEQMLAAVKKSA